MFAPLPNQRFRPVLDRVGAVVHGDPSAAAAATLPAVVDDALALTVDARFPGVAPAPEKNCMEKYLESLSKKDPRTAAALAHEGPAELMAHVPVAQRRLDFLRYCGGRQENGFVRRMAKWSAVE